VTNQESFARLFRMSSPRDRGRAELPWLRSGMVRPLLPDCRAREVRIDYRLGGVEDSKEVAWLANSVYGGDLAQWRSRMERTLAREDYLVLAHRNGAAIGYGEAAICQPADAEDTAPGGYYLTGLVVLPGWRRNGVGSELTRWRLEWIWSRQHPAYFLPTPAMGHPWRCTRSSVSPRSTALPTTSDRPSTAELASLCAPTHPTTQRRTASSPEGTANGAQARPAPAHRDCPATGSPSEDHRAGPGRTARPSCCGRRISGLLLIAHPIDEQQAARQSRLAHGKSLGVLS